MIREKRQDDHVVEGDVILQSHEPSDHKSAEEEMPSRGNTAKDCKVGEKNCEKCGVRQQKILKLQKYKNLAEEELYEKLYIWKFKEAHYLGL